MTPDFAPEVAKYPSPQSSYFWSVRAYCFTPLAMQLVLVEKVPVISQGNAIARLRCVRICDDCFKFTTVQKSKEVLKLSVHLATLRAPTLIHCGRRFTSYTTLYKLSDAEQ